MATAMMKTMMPTTSTEAVESTNTVDSIANAHILCGKTQLFGEFLVQNMTQCEFAVPLLTICFLFCVSTQKRKSESKRVQQWNEGVNDAVANRINMKIQLTRNRPKRRAVVSFHFACFFFYKHELTGSLISTWWNASVHTVTMSSALLVVVRMNCAVAMRRTNVCGCCHANECFVIIHRFVFVAVVCRRRFQRQCQRSRFVLNFKRNQLKGDNFQSYFYSIKESKKRH